VFAAGAARVSASDVPSTHFSGSEYVLGRVLINSQMSDLEG